MKMFLNGTAMAGQGDHQFIGDAPFLGHRRTAAAFRFFAVRDEFPGLLPDPTGGQILGELYELDPEVWTNSLAPAEPRELELGTIELDDGTVVNAMILQFDRITEGDPVVDITHFGGWRAYQARLNGAS